MKDEPYIYEIEVTKENIPSMLSHELMRLMTRYGPRAKEEIACFVLPPSAFLCFQEWGRGQCRIFCENGIDGMMFEGVHITCGYAPFIQIAFKPSGWHYAHREAKRFTDKFGATDC